MKPDFILTVGGLKVAVTCMPSRLGQELKKRYKAFITTGQSDCAVILNWQAHEEAPAFLFSEPEFTGHLVRFNADNYQGQVDIQAGSAQLTYRSNLVLEEAEYFLRVIYALLAFERGSLLFHAAGIRRGSNGFAFFGLSGSGKTTVARNSPAKSVLNDDLVLLRPEGETWLMYATPFWNPSQVAPQPINTYLTALLRLVQAKAVKLEPLRGATAYAELVANVPVINQNPAQAIVLLNRIGKLLVDVPAYRLHFLPDDSFWQVVLPLGG